MFAKRFLLVVVLLFLPFILTGSITRTFFAEYPASSAEWEITTQFNNHIGDEITIIVRVSSAPGIRLDFDRFPDVGESFDLSKNLLDDYYDQWLRLNREAPDSSISYSGELEVLERIVSRHFEGDFMITEVVYTLQYLDPIDFSRAYTSKRLEGSYSIGQRFWILDKQGDVVRRSWRHVRVGSLDFQILRRVETDDEPIFNFLRLTMSTLRPHFYLKIMGIGIIAGAVIYQLWGSVKAIRKNRKEGLLALESQTVPPTLQDLYLDWVRTGLYSVFLQAVILYRSRFLRKPVLWIKTTYILYSGKTLSDRQVEDTLLQLIEGGGK